MSKKGKRRKGEWRPPKFIKKFWKGYHGRNDEGIALALEDSRRLEESGRPIQAETMGG